MRANRTHQPLTYDVRLPDEAQADTLRLLDESRAVVNQALTILWPHLDEFGSERIGPAFLIPRMRLPSSFPECGCLETRGEVHRKPIPTW